MDIDRFASVGQLRGFLAVFLAAGSGSVVAETCRDFTLDMPYEAGGGYTYVNVCYAGINPATMQEELVVRSCEDYPAPPALPDCLPDGTVLTGGSDSDALLNWFFGHTSPAGVPIDYTRLRGSVEVRDLVR